MQPDSSKFHNTFGCSALHPQLETGNWQNANREVTFLYYTLGGTCFMIMSDIYVVYTNISCFNK
jgi:hypothetical protein